jgi:hypothetical protein
MATMAPMVASAYRARLRFVCIFASGKEAVFGETIASMVKSLGVR